MVLGVTDTQPKRSAEPKRAMLVLEVQAQSRGPLRVQL